MTRYLTLAILFLAPLIAQEDLVRLPVSRPTNTFGRFGLELSILGWQPMDCPYQYGLLDNTTSLDVRSGYEAGFRVSATYTRVCSYLTASYLWFDEKKHEMRSSLEGDVSVPYSSGTFDRVTGFLRSRYQTADIRLGTYLHRGAKCSFSLFANTRWVYLHHTRKSEGADNVPIPNSLSYHAPIIERDNEGRPILNSDKQPIPVTDSNGKPVIERVTESWNVDNFVPTAFFRQGASFEGGGVGLGFDTYINLWCWFGLHLELNGLAIIGDAKTRFNDFQAEGEAREFSSFHKSSCVIPALDTRVGLNYTWTCNALAFELEIGYETNYYWRVLPLAPNSSPTTRNWENIGFAGPYGSATLRF